MAGRRAALTALLSERVASEARQRPVLDIGCGVGDLGAALAAQGFRTIDGIDTNESWIEAAGTTQAYLRLIRASLAEGVPLSADTHELALCRAFDPPPSGAAAALKEVARLVRPEGRALLVVKRGLHESPPFAAAIERAEALGQASLKASEDLAWIDPSLRLLDFHILW